ncbi:MAG: Asp23/Gls24 family envelope stress response protein [Sporomusaceae bacterium]|jgi:ABC-type oligopeptide transport system ATPase subunit|nr:Asp23/Gls24 family envelope stress response protein [Sporomusaceae bacterium]
MEVVALVGPSGTGKSHRALIVAEKNKADVIIDDGILIKDNKIIAGYSAKREKNKIQAVKRAIFAQKNHASEVADAISRLQPKKILILGTSENMVHKIAKILNIPDISKVIRIEEVATESEISKALETRVREGKHIIPVPTIELKPHFSGYLIDPLAIFFKKNRSKKSSQLAEKSIVRPTFSFYGKLIISDAAIAGIVQQVAKESPYIIAAGHIGALRSNDAYKDIFISLEIIVKYGAYFIPTAVAALQEQIKEAAELMTGMSVKEVNITVRSVSKKDK